MDQETLLNSDVTVIFQLAVWLLIKTKIPTRQSLTINVLNKQGYEYQISTIINGWTLSFTKNFELGYSWPRTENGNIYSNP